MNIQLLLTGNELMSGDIVDSNSAMIADYLLEAGIRIHKKVTVGDDPGLLLEQLDQLSRDADVLLVNGGLGPTLDDLTAEVLARLCEQPLQRHPEAFAHLKSWCSNRGTRLNDANLKQTLLPAGAAIIPNPRGSAVGIRLNHNDCDILCTPGVPGELRAMLEQSILPELSACQPAEQKLLRRRFHTFGLGESGLQQLIADQLPDWPEDIELGFRAGAPTLEVKLQSPLSRAGELEQWAGRLQQLIGDYIVAEGSASLSQNLVELLSSRGLKITTAESCTGGLIASMLTRIPGSSAVFESGFVTYADTSKNSMLGVSETTLARHGAVSEPVVREMVVGALSHSDADVAVAVSGIAGPDGGSDRKPVGLVWIGWGSGSDIRSACLYFPYGRQMFQTMVAGAGLDLVRRLVCRIETPPRYLSERQPPQS